MTDLWVTTAPNPLPGLHGSSGLTEGSVYVADATGDPLLNDGVPVVLVTDQGVQLELVSTATIGVTITAGGVYLSDTDYARVPGQEAVGLTSDSDVDDTDGLYWVNLSLKIAAPDPATAVRAFIEGILQHGLRGFAYSVENHDTRELAGVFDGFGDPINPSELVESEEASDTEREELLALAVRMNETNDPTASTAP